MSNSKSSDILVIGSGLAGLLFAYNVAEASDYQITVITKDDLKEANISIAGRVVQH